MREHDVHTGPRGLRLRLCSWGPPAGRPTLILHGYLEQAAAWDEVACALDRRVVAPDHRGHGLSEHVGAGGWYYFWDYVRDVDAVIDHIGGPVDLIGHSMGGTIATLLAATRPEKVRRLVLIEGLGMPDTRHEAMERARQFLDARTDPPRHGTFSGPEEAAARLQRASPRLSDARALALATRVLRRVTSEVGEDGCDPCFDDPGARPSIRHISRSPGTSGQIVETPAGAERSIGAGPAVDAQQGGPVGGGYLLRIHRERVPRGWTRSGRRRITEDRRVFRPPGRAVA